MKVRRCRAQGFIKPGPVGNQQRRYLTQPQIVLGQNVQHPGVREMILENPAFLLQNAAILGQSRIIIGPELT